MRETRFCSEHRMRFIRPTTTEDGISNDRRTKPGEDTYVGWNGGVARWPELAHLWAEPRSKKLLTLIRIANSVTFSTTRCLSGLRESGQFRTILHSYVEMYYREDV